MGFFFEDEIVELLLESDWHDRVVNWFNSPKQTLEAQGYTDPESDRHAEEQYHKKIIIRHNFARAADTFLPPLGIVSPWKDDNISISMAGEIIYENGAIETVLFTYGLSPKKKTLYHRCATIKAPHEIIFEFWDKGFWKSSNPAAA